MIVGEFFFVKEKKQENSQWILVRCMSESEIEGKKNYYYMYFDKENKKLYGDLILWNEEKMESSPFGTARPEMYHSEEYWERYL